MDNLGQSTTSNNIEPDQISPLNSRLSIIDNELPVERISMSSSATMAHLSPINSGHSVLIEKPAADRDVERNIFSTIKSRVLKSHNTSSAANNTSIKMETEASIPESDLSKWYPPPLPNPEVYIVEYDGPNDPMNPQNWKMKKKVVTTAMLGFTAMVSVFTSSIFSTAAAKVAAQFDVSLEVGVLGLSLYVLGFAFGPIFWAPVSELKGRRPVLVWSMLGFSIFQIGTAAAKDIQTILICRFWGGMFGAAPVAVIGAVFADIYDNRTRGLAMNVFATIVFAGPLFAPFIGGFITSSSLGWRWTQWLTAILGFTSFLINLTFLEESFTPAILVTKAVKLRQKSHNWAIHAKQEEVEVDIKQLFTRYFSRPLRMLFLEPIILLVSIYMAFIYGILYLFLTAYPIVFQRIHGMSPGVGGLPYFGITIGVVLGGIFVALTQPGYNRKLAANNNINVPEWRLPPTMVGGVVFAIGIFCFGWSGYKSSIHWIFPSLSGLLTGFGLLSIFLQSLNYIIDAYLMYAASALAANSLLRSLAGAGFPLFAQYLFDALGINWGCTIIGAIATILIPIPVFFYHYGHRIRARSSFNPHTPK